MTRSHRRPSDGEPIGIRRTGDQVAGRSLDFYQAVGRRLADQGAAMTAHADIVPSVVDRIKQTMVGLKPRTIEILDATVRRLVRGEVTALEVIDALLAEEYGAPRMRGW